MLRSESLTLNCWRAAWSLKREAHRVGTGELRWMPRSGGVKGGGGRTAKETGVEKASACQLPPNKSCMRFQWSRSSGLLSCL